MSRKFRFSKDELIVTPEMRAAHLEHSRQFFKGLSWSYARRFPWSYIKNAAAAAGIPLEITRWINRNDHKPRAWLKSYASRLSNTWDKLKIVFHRVPKSAYEIGTEEELRSFVASMNEKKSSYGSTFRRGPFFYTEPGDLIINREIIEPGTNGTFLNGAVGFRFDEDFFAFAALPFRFRKIPVEKVMSILFPDRPVSEYEFLPDSGSPEMEARMEELLYSNIALKMVLDTLGPSSHDDYTVTITGETYTVLLLRDNAVVRTQTLTKKEIKAFDEAH